MRVNVNAPLEVNRQRFQDSVIEQVTNALQRFSTRITSVNVTLTDENGPRGGIDKQCRVSLVLPPFGQLTASATAENPWAALARAAERVRRVILTKLQRPKSLQIRRRKGRSPLSGSLTEDETET